MPDQNPRLLVEIEADSGKFNVNLNGVKQSLNETAKQGATGFSGLTESVIGLNQGLELAEKILQGVHAALETIDRVEAWDNQRIALQALGAQVGLSKTQLELLTQTIQKASSDTLTSVQSTTAAFKLLNAGVKAEAIPSLIEFAQRAEETRGIPLEEGINKLAFAIESGATRGLKQMGIELDRVGSRQQVLNAILDQSHEYLKNTGDGYENFGKRVGTMFSELKEKATSIFGTGLRDVGIGVMGTDAEKASLEMKKLSEEMAKVDAAAKAGRQDVEVFIQGPGGEPAMNKILTVTEARAQILKQMGDSQSILNKHSAEEGKIIEDNTKKFKQQKELVKPVDEITAQQIRVQNQKKMYDELYNNDKIYLDNATAITKARENAQRQEIEATFQKEIRDLKGKPMTREQYARKEMEIEKKKYDAITKMSKDAEAISAKNLRDGFIQGIGQMESSYGHFTKTISKMTVGLGHTMSSTFISMAKEHKFSMDEMLKNMLEFIGESLIQDGTANLLKGAALSIFGGAGGALMAAGAAEIAAGSVLVGGGSSSSSSGAGGGGAGGFDAGASQLAPPTQVEKQKSAAIYINGDFLNSHETATRIQEIVRKNSDITNFAILPQGQSW